MSLKNRINDLALQGAFTSESLQADKDLMLGYEAARQFVSYEVFFNAVQPRSFANNQLWRAELEHLAEREQTTAISAILDVLITTDGPVLKYQQIPHRTDTQIKKLAKQLTSVLGGNDMAIESKLFAIQAATQGDKVDEFSPAVSLGIMERILTNGSYKYEPKTDEWSKKLPSGSYRVVAEAEVSAEIETYVYRYQINRDRGIKTAAILSELGAYKRKVMDDKVSNLQLAVRHVAGTDGYRVEYLTAWHSLLKIEQDLDIWIVLISHFFWQVKRRLNNMMTAFEIMLAFYGKQGIGKSFLSRKIFGDIFGDLYDASITLDRLCDERNARVLMDNYVINIEELAQQGGTDMAGLIRNGAAAKLKTIISEPRTSYRPLGTNRSEQIKINASVISNANFHIYDVINDESGMRRFFEFTSARGRGETIHKVDPVTTQYLYDNSHKFIQSIDESTEYGYWDSTSETGQKIDAIQLSYIRQNSFDEYMNEYVTLGDVDMPNKEWKTKAQIVDQYKIYCQQQGIDNRYIVRNFDSKLADFCGPDRIKKIHNIKHLCVEFVTELKAPTQFQPNRPGFSASDFGAEAQARRDVPTMSINDFHAAQAARRTAETPTLAGF